MEINNYLCFLNLNANESFLKILLLLILLTFVLVIFLGLFHLKDKILYVLSIPKKILAIIDEKLAYILINRYNDDVKLFVFKWSLIFAAISGLILIIVGFIWEVNKNDSITSLYWISIIIFFVLSFIMIYLMTHTKLDNPGTPPIEMKHNLKNYEEFKESIIQSLQDNNYNIEDRVDIKNNESETMIIIETKKNETLVIQIIWMEDYNNDILDEYTNAFYLEVMKRVGEKTIERHHVKLIQYVCVQRQNSKFKEFVSNELPQDFYKSQIITGISIGGKKAYISRTSFGFFVKDYKKMKEINDVLTKDIFFEVRDNNFMI